MTSSHAFPRFVPPPVPTLDVPAPRPTHTGGPEHVAEVAPVPATAAPGPATRPRPDFPRPGIGRRTLGAA